jgi:hypothetical protein
MTGQEYRAVILSTGMTITAYAQHIGLTRHALQSRFKLAKVTNEMVLAAERVADRWLPIESAPMDGDMLVRNSKWKAIAFRDIGLSSYRFFDPRSHSDLLFQPTHWKPLPEWEKQS